jgi:hypothetical protein
MKIDPPVQTPAMVLPDRNKHHPEYRHKKDDGKQQQRKAQAKQQISLLVFL